MPLDPQAKRLIDMLGAGTSAARDLTPAAMRRTIAGLAPLIDCRHEPIAAVAERAIPGPAGDLPARIYAPRADAADLPGLVYFHGGTGVFCDLDTHDGLCRMLANASGCRVVSVGYRLAPEHPFPAAIEDSHGALQWALRHGRELGIDPARLAVGGDSAGATLAAVACQRARDEGGTRPALQLLFCPVTDVAAASASRLAFAQGYFFDTALLDWSLGHYCPGRDPADPWLSPLRARDFHDLPPAHIHTAEFDPFRDEGEAYAAALRQAGVPVHQLRHPGMIHHFYCMAGAIAAARDAVRTAGEALGAALRQSR